MVAVLLADLSPHSGPLTPSISRLTVPAFASASSVVPYYSSSQGSNISGFVLPHLSLIPGEPQAKPGILLPVLSGVSL